MLKIFCNFSIYASILFSRSWIIFAIITLNSFSSRLSMSTLLSCSSGVLSRCSFTWDTFLCHLILSNVLWLQFLFHRLQDCSSSCFCCLPSGEWGHIRSLCRLPGGRDWFLPTGEWSLVLFLWWSGPFNTIYLKDYFLHEISLVLLSIITCV